MGIGTAAIKWRKHFEKICSLHSQIQYVHECSLNDWQKQKSNHRSMSSSSYCVWSYAAILLQRHISWMLPPACSEVKMSCSLPFVISCVPELYSSQSAFNSSRLSLIENSMSRMKQSESQTDRAFVHVLGFELYPWHSVWPLSGSVAWCIRLQQCWFFDADPNLCKSAMRLCSPRAFESGVWVNIVLNNIFGKLVCLLHPRPSITSDLVVNKR